MAVTLTPIPDIPMVRPGDDLAGLLIVACERNALAPADGDVVVVAQKIVSKAEGRYVDLAKVKPSPRAASLATEVNKDPRLVEVILGESRRVVRQRPGVLIVEHRLGFIMANAGVDRSNIDLDVAAEPVLLLPSDPDASAARLCERLAAPFRSRPGAVPTGRSIVVAGSRVPHRSLGRARATFMPDTAWAVSRLPPGSSRGNDFSPVSMSSVRFRHFISGALAFAFSVLT